MVIELDDDDFSSKAGKGLFLVDFWAPWCIPCQKMGPVFHELEDEFRNKLKFAKFNIEDNEETQKRYDVMGIPCLLLLKDGEEAGRIVGFMEKELLRKKIAELLKKAR